MIVHRKVLKDLSSKQFDATLSRIEPFLRIHCTSSRLRASEITFHGNTIKTRMINDGTVGLEQSSCYLGYFMDSGGN